MRFACTRTRTRTCTSAHLCICVFAQAAFCLRQPLLLPFPLRAKSLPGDMLEMLVALLVGAIGSRDRLRDQTAEGMRSLLCVRIFGNVDPESLRVSYPLAIVLFFISRYKKSIVLVNMFLSCFLVVLYCCLGSLDYLCFVMVLWRPYLYNLWLIDISASTFVYLSLIHIS